MNQAVLVQEYLTGTEYVVDSMSMDGEHKIMILWDSGTKITGEGYLII